MKLKIFFLILTSFSLINADQYKKINAEARACYDRNDYAKAFALYDSIENKGCMPLYNMGNCQYKMGNCLQAIICWQKALKCASAAQYNDIAYNIEIAEEKLGVEKKASSWQENLRDSINKIPLIFLQLLFLASLFLLFFFIKKYKHGTKYTALILSMILLINVIFFVMLIMNYNERVKQKGIIMKTHAAIFAGPNEQYHKLGELSIASRVAIVQQRDNWCKVENKEMAGWLLADDIVVL